MWQLCYFCITLASLRVQNEVEILQSVNHPCVIKLEDVSLKVVNQTTLSIILTF